MPKKSTEGTKTVKPKIAYRNVNALNISMHPHPPGTYINVFKKLSEDRTVVKFHGDRAGFIRSFNKDGLIYFGVLAMFTDINLAKAWINTSTGDPASDEDMKGLNVPKNLRPEYSSVEFVFNPKSHKMIFVNRELKPASAKSFIEKLIKQHPTLENYDSLEITVVQDEEELQKILRSPSILEITIEINTPNADTNENLEVSLEKRLERIQSSKKTEVYSATRGKYLKPDEEMRDMCEIALTNGQVDAKVWNGRKTELRSTSKFPKEISISFDTTKESVFNALKKIISLF